MPFLLLSAPSPRMADTNAIAIADTLDPIVVEAPRVAPDGTRTRTSLSVDQAEVRRYAAPTISDALVSLPGVQVARTGPWASSPVLRGMGGNRIQVQVDGVDINTARGHGAQPSLVNVQSVEGVDLTLGATSARTGSGGMGGTINMRTLTPLFAARPSLGFEVRGRGAGPGALAGVGAHARYRGASFGMEARAAQAELGHLETARGKVDNSGYTERSAAARAAASAAGLVADLDHSYSEVIDAGLPAFASPAGGDASFPLSSRRATRLELQYALPGDAHARVVSAVQEFRTDFAETTVDSIFSPLKRFLGTSTNAAFDQLTTNAWSVDPAVEVGSAVRVTFFGRLSGQESAGPRTTETTTRNRQGDVTGVTTSAGENVPDSERFNWGAGAGVVVPSRWVRLEATVRRDHFDSDADSTRVTGEPPLHIEEGSTSWALGAARRFVPVPGADAVELFASGGSGFRAPGLDERFFNGYIHGGLRLFGNRELVPETSRQYEAGLRVLNALGGRLAWLRVSAYRSDVEEMITLTYLGQLYLQPRFQYVNLERARLEGVEADARVPLWRARLTLGASFPRGVDRASGEPINTVGSSQLSAELAVPLAREQVQVFVRYRHSGAVDGSDDEFDRESYQTVAASVSWRLGPMEAIATVANLFDAYYFEPLSAIPEPGRTISLAINTTWDAPIAPTSR